VDAALPDLSTFIRCSEIIAGQSGVAAVSSVCRCREEKGAGKGGPGGDDRRNENTVKVMNLSDDTREGDVEALFQRFGHITRTFMPKRGGTEIQY